VTLTALAWLWAAAVVVVRLRRRPGLPRALDPVASVARPETLARGQRRKASLTSPLASLAGAHRRAIVLGAVTVVLVLVARPLALLIPAVMWGLPRWQAAREGRARATAVASEVPEVVDLLRLAVGSGLTVPLAVAAVGRRGRGALAAGLAHAAAASRRGRRLADALDELPAQLGEPARALASTLAGSERYGHAIGPALERLAAECRDDQRRQAEAAARRVPVLLLFPLVLCILPAFALLTVAPLVAGALRALHL
jgi:tight adherence protein C